jgi:hypothetical protein
MSYEELVFDALRYRRNVGADLDSIRAYVFIRESEKHTHDQDREILSHLVKAGKATQVGELWFLSSKAYKNAKGSALAPKWEWSDSWILLSILYASRKSACKLEDLLAMADGINVATPTFTEVHGALNRLASGRLLKAQQSRLSVTENALALFAKVESSCKKNVYDQLNGLWRLINCPCCGVSVKAVRWSINIGQDEYDDALKAYHNRVRGG